MNGTCSSSCYLLSFLLFVLNVWPMSYLWCKLALFLYLNFRAWLLLQSPSIIDVSAFFYLFYLPKSFLLDAQIHTSLFSCISKKFQIRPDQISLWTMMTFLPSSSTAIPPCFVLHPSFPTNHPVCSYFFTDVNFITLLHLPACFHFISTLHSSYE